MASTAALKRTFGQSGLDGYQVGDGGTTPGTGNKLIRLTVNAHPARERRAALDCLPAEILSHIASHLSTSELLSLRLANRTIEAQLFNDFATYYFAKKQFMLTAESLQTLVDISRHPQLSAVLQHVIISLDKYELGMTLHHFAGVDPATRLARATKYCKGAYDQHTFLSTGRDRELLTQAFRNLPNLKTVGLRDYNSGMRWRDGEGAEWRAYGATTVMKETGLKLLERNGSIPHFLQYAGTGTSVLFAARAFSTLLHALGASGATPENIEVLLRWWEHGLADIAFHIPTFLEPTVAPVLRGLRSLLLTVSMGNMAMLNLAPTDAMYDNMPRFALENFLALAPNITHLRLNLRMTYQENLSSYDTRFLTRLVPADPEAGPQLLPELEQLDLGMLGEADAGLLCHIVGRWSGTLKGVNFWKVSLSDSPEQQAALQLDPQAKPNRWAELLVRLPKVAPGLERISVGCLAQRCRGQAQRIALNIASGSKGRPPVTREYGREEIHDSKRFRQMLEDELKVLWTTDLSDGEESGGEGDDSDAEQSDDSNEDEDE